MREGRQQDYGFDSCDDDCMYGGGGHHHHNHHHYSFHYDTPPHDGKDLPLGPFHAKPGKRGSATMIQHISVISRSETSEYSLTGPRSLRELNNAAAAAASGSGMGMGSGGSGRGGVPPVLFGVGRDVGAAKRRFNRIVGSGGIIGRQLSNSFGFFTPTGTSMTVGTDLGTSSVVSNTNASEGGGDNPYHYYHYYHHAGVRDNGAASRTPPEVAAAAAGLTIPSSASFGLHVNPSSTTSVPRVPSVAAIVAGQTQAHAALTEREAYELRTLRASPLSRTPDGNVRL